MATRKVKATPAPRRRAGTAAVFDGKAFNAYLKQLEPEIEAEEARAIAAAPTPRKRRHRSGPFRPTWRTPEDFMTAPRKDTPFARQVLAFQKAINDNERLAEWAGYADWEWERHVAAQDARSRGGVQMHANETANTWRHRRSAVIKACDILSGWTDKPRATGLKGWTPYGLALRVIPRSDSKAWRELDEDDREDRRHSYGSFSVVLTTLRGVWRGIAAFEHTPAEWHRRRSRAAAYERYADAMLTAAGFGAPPIADRR